MLVIIAASPTSASGSNTSIGPSDFPVLAAGRAVRIQVSQHLLHRARPRLAPAPKLEYERRIAKRGTAELGRPHAALAEIFFDDSKQHNLAPTRLNVH